MYLIKSYASHHSTWNRLEINPWMVFPQISKFQRCFHQAGFFHQRYFCFFTSCSSSNRLGSWSFRKTHRTLWRWRHLWGVSGSVPAIAWFTLNSRNMFISVIWSFIDRRAKSVFIPMLNTLLCYISVRTGLVLLEEWAKLLIWYGHFWRWRPLLKDWWSSS